MAASKQANDNGGRQGSYELGDLEIVSNGRPSGERLVERAAGAEQPNPARPAAPRTLTLDEDTGPALELDVAPLPSRRPAGPQTGAAPRRGSTQAPARPAPPGARGASAVGQSLEPCAGGAAADAPSSLGDSLQDDFDEGRFANLPAIEVETVAARSAERVVVHESAPEDPRVAERKEAQRVAALADYGEVPRSLLACVGYAARVASRVLKLRSERAAVRLDVQQRAEAHHTALVKMGAQLMALGDRRLEPLRSQVARVLDERGKVDQAGQSVAQLRSESQRALKPLLAKIGEQEQKLAPFQEAERAALAVQRKADEEVRRAQALHKRVEIELRALSEASTSDPAREAALTAQLAQRSAAVAELLSALARANDALGRSRRELALELGGITVLQEQQRQLESAARAREAEAEGQRKAADGAYALSLRELAEAARTQKLSALVQELELEVQGREAALQEAGETLVRFDRALVLYDRTSVIKGASLLAALVIAALAILITR